MFHHFLVNRYQALTVAYLVVTDSVGLGETVAKHCIRA